MDPLSDVLSMIKPRSYACAGFDIGGDHSIWVPAQEGIFCYALMSGQVWIMLDDDPTPVLLTAGDCVVLPTGRAFTSATDLALTPVDQDIIQGQGERIGSVHRFNGGGKCFIIGCHFVVDGANAEVLLNLLPAMVHIKTDEDRATLRWALDRMRLELHDRQPGGSLIVEHLAQLMLLQALRLHLVEGGVGWLFALGDNEMSAAITAIHRDPAHRWTVEALAEKAGMSRTKFAVQFKEAVGTPPLDYLRRWRMLLAANRLKTTTESISAIALSLGYESESAFSTAFKRVNGVSPRRYAQQQTGAGDL